MLESVKEKVMKVERLMMQREQIVQSELDAYFDAQNESRYYKKPELC